MQPVARRVARLWLVVGVLCALLCAFVAFYLYKTREVLQREALQDAVLYARLVDAQFTRSVSSVGNTLRVVDHTLETLDRRPDQARDGAWLADQIAGQPVVRSLSLLDAEGRVLASSVPDNANRVVPPAAVGCNRTPGDPRLGDYLPARDLFELARSGAEPALANALPMTQHARLRDGSVVCTVALLNLDRFATEGDAILEGDQSTMTLYGLDGRLLSASSGVRRAPGTWLLDPPLFARLLGDKEYGSWRGPGVDGVAVVAGYRASRNWPLITVVEKPEDLIRARLLKEAAWPVGIGVALMLFLVAVGVREQATMRREADANARSAALARKIAESDARSRAIFEHAGVGILQLARDGRVLRANSALCDLLGYTEQEVAGLRAADFMESAPEPDTDPDTATPGGRPQGARAVRELRLRRKDGSHLWVRMTTSAGRDAKGRRYTIGVVEDISERRLAQLELYESRQRELDIGARIQRALLVPPADQQLPGVWLSSLSIASQGIDGDFVEVMPLGDACIDIVAGDVMGKGLGAALMGAGVKMLVSRSIARLVTEPAAQGKVPAPAQIVGALHRAVTADLQTLESFVTLSYLRIDTAANTVTWVGCGHEEPMLVHKAGGGVRLSNQHPPVGVLDDIEYTQETVPFVDGDGLLIFSDGIVDAVAHGGQRVGRERLAAEVESRVREHDTPAAILHALRRDLLSGGVRPNDDVTMLVALRKDAARATIRHEYATTLESVGAVWAQVSVAAQCAGLDEAAAGLFATGCVEAFTNIVRHNQDVLEGAPTELVMRNGADGFTAEFIYQGRPFVPPATITMPPLDDFPRGGLGLTIMRDVASRVEYSHTHGVSQVRLTRPTQPDT